MLEFDIVMKSRGFSHGQRMLQHALLAKDYPDSTVKVRPVSPMVLYLSAKIEGEEGTDYFDAGVAAEAGSFDGIVVSSDRGFDKLKGLKRIWGVAGARSGKRLGGERGRSPWAPET